LKEIAQKEREDGGKEKEGEGEREGGMEGGREGERVDDGELEN